MQPAVRWIAYCVLRCVLRIAYCVFMGSDPRKPKLENHWARRKSDKTARETMEHTGATTELRGERESGERGPTSMINTGGARRKEERSSNCTTALYPRVEGKGSNVNDALMAEGVVNASGLPRLSCESARTSVFGARWSAAKSGQPGPSPHMQF